MEVRDFDERTLEDAKMLVKERFGESTCSLLVRYLRNPLRRICPSVGDIVYRAGVPIAFQAANIRCLYLRHEKFLGINGSLFCKMPDAKLKDILSVFLRTVAPRSGRAIYFGNTAIPLSSDIGVAHGMTIGPESCGNIRFAILRLGSFMDFILKGHLPKSIVTIIDAVWMFGAKILEKGKVDGCVKKIESFIEMDADDFWNRYLRRNNGLVCSRTKEELEWIFGDNLRCGKVIFLTYVKNGVVEGYVAVKRQGDERNGRWMVVDWIAVGDDSEVLKELLKGVKAYLLNTKGAAFVEIIGYPMFIQGIIKSVFPFSRKASGNSFNYLIDNKCFRDKFSAVLEASWFFGAYDGDRCF